ncbi:hypothetical protein GCM10009630_40510 [Kribbella jejuensis]|uniref:Uncharacterized protein n=1 Tax=Kribbella jejuensis TaxID=236068 RepID=A0A542ES98_9ACTN|nr:hypothetical protein [Kribbella jejuensis]TQJ18046.1 hypothetical protein FB475_2178 [Kribbella jejuensis]
MPEEAVTTLRAELERFDRVEEGFALLEVFLEVARPQLGAVVLDPVGLRLPENMTADRAVVQKLIDEIEEEPVGRARVVERGFEMDDEQARWDYVRLAYSSNQATVWSRRQRTTYFEVAARQKATYWLPDSLKAEYFDALRGRGWAIPEDWLTAVAKRPKPWWKRGGFS